MIVNQSLLREKLLQHTGEIILNIVVALEIPRLDGSNAHTRRKLHLAGINAALGTLAAFGKKQLLIALIIAHSCEYMFIARPLADEKCIDQTSALIHTLLYGFTWWKPIKQGK